MSVPSASAFSMAATVPGTSLISSSNQNRDQYKGLKMVYEGPITALRHFTAGFELL